MNKNVKFSVKDLNLYYGKFHALKGVDMDIPSNEVTAFIGPSGCGKSTFLKSLNRMNDLVEGCKITGDVRLDGEDIQWHGHQPFEKKSWNGIPAAESFSDERV